MLSLRACFPAVKKSPLPMNTLGTCFLMPTMWERTKVSASILRPLWDCPFQSRGTPLRNVDDFRHFVVLTSPIIYAYGNPDIPRKALLLSVSRSPVMGRSPLRTRRLQETLEQMKNHLPRQPRLHLGLGGGVWECIQASSNDPLGCLEPQGLFCSMRRELQSWFSQSISSQPTSATNSPGTAALIRPSVSSSQSEGVGTAEL